MTCDLKSLPVAKCCVRAAAARFSCTHPYLAFFCAAIGAPLLLLASVALCSVTAGLLLLALL